MAPAPRAADDADGGAQLPCAACRDTGLTRLEDDAHAGAANAAFCDCVEGRQRRARAAAEEKRTADRIRQLDRAVRSEMALPKRCEGFTLASWPNRLDPQGRETAKKLSNFLDTWDRVRWLVLTGPYGTGKTGMAAGILDLLVPDAMAGVIGPPPGSYAPALLFTTAERFFRSIKTGWLDKTDGEVFKHHAEAGVLVLDDVGAEAPTDWVQREYQAMLNERYDEQRPTIITTNLGLDDLKAHLSERVWNRVMESSAFIEVKGRNLHDPRERELPAAGDRTRLHAVR